MHPNHIKLLVLGTDKFPNDGSVADALFQYLSYINIGEPEEIEYVTILDPTEGIGPAIYETCSDLKIPIIIAKPILEINSLSKYNHDLQIMSSVDKILILSTNRISDTTRYQMNLLSANDIDYTQIIINH
jgi:hypothetical protein